MCSKQGTTCLSYRRSLSIGLKTHHATVLQLRAGKCLLPKAASALWQCWQQSGGFTAACTVTEATQSPGPRTSLPLLGCILSRGAEAVHGNQKGKQTVVKHTTLKIPLKLMRIWLLAMSRAAAGPCHGLELQLNSYIFFPPSFS